MRPHALVLPALLALLACARGAGCPAGCACAEAGSIELHCRRARGDGVVFLEGERTKYLNIHCRQKETKDFVCEDIPEFDFGRNSTLEALGFHGCPLASLSFACVARRVQARDVLNLTVYDPPGGPQLLPANVEGLRGVRRLRLRGREEGDEEVTIPSEVLALLPGLERLTLTSARAQLLPGALRGARALARLEVSMARLGAPPPGALAGLPALRELSLFRNDIENITRDTFQNLTSLEVLDVSSNRLTELDGRALAAGCPRLRELYAYNNPLLALRPLAPLQHLEKLEIFDCDPEKPLELWPRALAALPRLAHASARGCLVRALPADLLAGSAALLALDLSDNSLSALPPSVFADQRMLRELDLGGNQLETLPKDVFWGLAGLQVLKLDNNRLVELPDRFVEGLPLRVLSAAGNRLQRVTRATLAGAPALEHLDLSRNRLAQHVVDAPDQYSNLEASPFNELLRLRTLDLSHNALAALYPDVPTALLLLRHLDMSHNNITSITDLDNSLSFLSSNVTVDLRDNNISLVELSPARLRAAPAPGYASRVLLAGNPLRCDCRLHELAMRVRGFAGPATLPALEAGSVACAAPPALRGRPLAAVALHDLVCEIPARLCAPGCRCVRHPLTIAMDCTERFDSLSQHFDNFPLELKLRFAPSSLSWIPATVQTLDLSDLNMTEVPADLNFGAIKYLDLRGNSLTRVPVELLEANVTLNLSRNPLSCDCWHASGLGSLQTHSALVADYEAVRCGGGFPARHVDAAHLCRALALSAGGALLALLGLASAVAAALLLRYSLHVKVLLYSCGWCGCWVREEDLDRDKQYDAFVSFAHEDRAFVLDALLPGLEGGPRPFRVCVHYRDWVAGEWIPAQIAASVEQSRRTIVVVSKNFLESMWGRLEFRAANMSAIKESRARVIVVLLEDIADHGELDAELQAYLATNTYLKWGDPWFWDKLRYALPHRAEEASMRRAGGQLARLVGRAGGGRGAGGPLDVKFAPNGKILNAAIKASPDHKIFQINIPSAVKASPV